MTVDDGAPATSLGQAIDHLITTLKTLDEASRLTALQAACSFLKIPLSAVGFVEPGTSSLPSPSMQPGPSAVSGSQDIRSLRELKSPHSANEMAALAAFYLAELAPAESRKGVVDVQDMVTCFKQAGFRLPKVPRQLLHNAVKAGYFDVLGEGRFRLNPVGYNLVAFQLPRTGSTDKPSHRRSSPRRRRQSRR